MTSAILLTALLLAPSWSGPQAGGFDHAHAAWTRLLADLVHPGGLVDYRGLTERRGELDGYLRSLEAVEPSDFARWSPEEREAFWINAYNAYTARLILDHYPVDSIKDIGGLFSSVFSKKLVPLRRLATVDERVAVRGKGELSLDEVEHGILAKVSRKPLFHFAIVCASRSCPAMRPEAYVAEKLDEQLAEQARAFLADPEKNDVRIVKARLAVSKIFDWSKGELESYPGGIRSLLRDFGPRSVVEDPALAEVELTYRKYDWSLNEWVPPTEER